MQLKQWCYFFFCVFLLNSCDDSDDSPTLPEGPATFDKGIFVLNEGNFGQGNSSVTYIDPATGVSSQNIFESVNEIGLGDTATDMAFFGAYAYIVLNVSNTIEVVNRFTFESVATIDAELNNPRKLAFLEGMLYVTNWGDGGDPTDDFVAVFGAQNFDLLTTIPLEEGPEEIVSSNGRIFVAHAGGWNFNNKVSVLAGNEVQKVIEVGKVPNSLTVAEGALWVSSAGLPDYAGETAGSISKINLSTLEVEKSFGFPDAGQHPANLTFHQGKLYYTLRSEVYSFSTNAEELPVISDFPIEEVAYLYGFEIHDGKLYAASANPDFTGNGKLFVYNLLGGNLLNQYDTGINPNGIFFNE